MMWLLLGTALVFAQAPGEPVASSAPAPNAASAPAPAAAAPGGFLIEGVPPGPPPPADRVEGLTKHIGSKMRCPVCQGMSVADSTSPAAVNFQNRIRELVAAGYAEDQIKAYFVRSYGEGILLEPTAKGLNLLVWVGPGLFVGLGLALVWSTVMQWRKEEDEVPLPSDVGLAPKDKYEQRLLAELED